MVMEIPARKPMNASLLMAVCAALVVKPLEATQIMIRHWIAASLLLALGVMLLPASGYAQSSDPEQQKKEQEFISEVNRKIEREFQIREKILAEKEQKKREEEAKGQQAEAAKHQFSSMWGRTVPNYMFDSYTLSEPPLRKR
jgi:septal ring factor EnvC (AmiA/AmiB activator)